MKRPILVLCCIFFIVAAFAQPRNVNKLTLERTYYYAEVHKSLRDLINQAENSAYMSDDFFNALLKKIVTDKQFSEKEKVQLFYLMQKKIGYAFVGLEYLPPKLNYFMHHQGKVFIFQRTRQSLRDLNYDVSGMLSLVDSSLTKDCIVAGNAVLLAALLNTDSTTKKLEKFTQPDYILKGKNPDIFNHYVCIGASILQNPAILANLSKCLSVFEKGNYLEDVLCALYAKNHPVVTIKDYILAEKKPANQVAIETALCALASKVPAASFQQSVKSLLAVSKDKWKIDLFKKILANKLPYTYSLSSAEQIVTKVWEGVNYTVYTEGTMILNGEKLMEWDPN